MLLSFRTFLAFSFFFLRPVLSHLHSLMFDPLGGRLVERRLLRVPDAQDHDRAPRGVQSGQAAAHGQVGQPPHERPGNARTKRAKESEIKSARDRERGSSEPLVKSFGLHAHPGALEKTLLLRLIFFVALPLDDGRGSPQVSCEGPQGKTSLAAVPPPPPMRTDLPKGEVDPASVKKHMHY